MPISHEINLLPRARIDRLHRDAILSVIRSFLSHVVLGLSMLTIIGVGLTVTLAVVGMRLQTTSTTDIDEVIEQYRDARTDILVSNAQWQYLSNIAEQNVSWSQALLELFEAVPPNGAVIRTMSAQLKVTDGVTQTATIELVGQTATRNLLDILKQQLEAVATVQTVHSPTSNLLKPLDTAFKLTVELVTPASKSAEQTGNPAP